VLNIVRVGPQQFAEIMGHISKEKRFVLPEFPAVNLYLAEFRTLVVLKDEIVCRDFPENQVLSIASAVQEGWNR
jgi:hypothetical protein